MIRREKEKYIRRDLLLLMECCCVMFSRCGQGDEESRKGKKKKIHSITRWARRYYTHSTVNVFYIKDDCCPTIPLLALNCELLLLLLYIY